MKRAVYTILSLILVLGIVTGCSPKVDDSPVTTAPVITKPSPSEPSSTEPPATEPPTTEPPVTEPPTTEPPVTEPPTTEPPVTEPPTTEPPVTEPPTTEPPVTEPPTTEPPVTEPPTTEPPVTEPPTTEPPVTEPPTTEPPVTEPPTTEPPVTEPPTTEPPVTEPPTTEPPVTEPPTTEPPVTEPPTTEPPVTEPPTTEPPVTEPPTTEPPITEPPTTEPPITEPPTTEPPVTEPPTTEPPITEPPTTEPPVTEPPTTEPPITEPPTTEPPVTEPPTTEPPITEPPTTEPPVTEPPTTEPPVTEPPTTEPPVTEPPTTEPPVTEPESINGMDLVQDALNYLYLPYVLGGNSLTDGTDCSGFTKLIFARFGIELPRTPSAQNKVGTIIPVEEAKPGDLLVETYPQGHYYDGHAGIYIGGGKMVSAMPNSGVIVTDVHPGMDYIRLYDNCYAGTDLDAYFEVLECCISHGNIGNYHNCRIDWGNGTATFTGVSPLGDYISLKLDSPTPGYESLLDAWKKTHLARSYIEIEITDGNSFSFNYAYWNGNWYLDSEIYEMCDSGVLTKNACYETMCFYGAFWNSNAVITNGFGENVDLSTCPGLINYSSLTKPGNPNEGKTCLPPYAPNNTFPCKSSAHRWDIEDLGDSTLRTCHFCGYQIIYYDTILEHDHMCTCIIYIPDWFEEDDEACVIYTCMGCRYRYTVPFDPVTGEGHDHDYSYLEYTVESTCIMDGYTYHACDCGVYYKDALQESHGHDYGDDMTCDICGHTEKKHS